MKTAADMQHEATQELRTMLTYATPAEAIVILGLIERSAVLARDVEHFAQALSETRKAAK